MENASNPHPRPRVKNRVISTSVRTPLPFIVFVILREYPSMLRHIPAPRALLLAALVPLAALTATRPASAQQAPQAAPLLHKTAKTFAATRALTFTLAAQQVAPGMRLAGITQGDGTAVWPDNLVFSGAMQQTPALSMSFVTVMCGSDQYVELGDGNFQKMAGLPNVGRLLFSSDTSFVSSILSELATPSAPKAVTVDGVAMWYLRGVVPPAILAHLPTAITASTDTLRAELWIGQRDTRLHRLTLNGAMFQGDSTTTTRTLTFSHFDEKPAFTVPRGTVPCQPKS